MNHTLKSIISFIVSVFAINGKAGQKLRLQLNNEYNEVKLLTTGYFPTWLQGSLIKNCTVPIFENGKETTHYFDGVAMLQSFKFQGAQLTYTSRFLKSGSYGKVLASDPEFYQREVDAKQWEDIQDAAVNVFNYGKDYVALTESPLPVRFDLQTLETIGNFEFKDNLPKSHTWESAHPHLFAETGEIFNFLIEYGRKSYYVLYKLVNSRREVIGKIPTNRPGYMHSFAMTENYLILVEFPLVVNPLRLAIAKVDSFASYIGLFDWKPEQGTRFFVVDKKTGQLVSELKTKAFFSFHHANAYEQGEEIIIDLTASNFAQLESILPQSSGSEATIQGLHRFRLDMKNQSIADEAVLEKTLEFPKITDHLDGKPYRYLYMVNYDPNDSAIVKYDWQEKKEISWHVPNTTIVEPTFVPSPEATSEDDGIVLTIITDTITQSSRLVILDAKSLTEVGQADLPEVFPNSFHGQFFSREKP